MAEFNPYKLEEEKWTPNNVYEILPPNAVSWTNYQYSEGSDNVDTEAANKSLIDGFVDFFAELLGTAGKILGGAVELGGAVLGGFVDGVVSLIGGIANAIGSIFGGGSGESPNLPLFNPIKTNLEAAIQPHRDKINESWQKTEEILAEQEVLRGQMADSIDEMRDASSRAQEASERAGVAITEAEAAVAAAEDARETLEEYNTELNKRITTEFNSAVDRADTAVERADTLAGELADFKRQHQAEIDAAVSKAEKAAADLATLSPKVADAVNKASKATSDVSALTPKVTAAQKRADSAYTEAGKVRSEVTPKIEAAQSKGETALAAADKAIANAEFVAGFADDLIPKDDNGVSTWNADLEPVDDAPEKSAFGSERTAIMNATFTVPLSFDPVKGQEVYRLTLWARRAPGTTNGGFSFHLRDSSEKAKWTHSRINFKEWLPSADRSDPYVVISGEGWEKHTVDFRWPESAGPAFVRLQLNNGNTFYVHDVQVRVIAPVDNSVDLAQNDAIRALNDTARQQGEINEAQRVANLAQKNFNDNQTKWNQAVDRSLATQKTVNDNIRKWSDGAATAIEANTKAIAALNAPQTGSSIVPMVPGTNTPTWIEPLRENSRGAQTADSKLPESITKYYGWAGGAVPAGEAKNVDILHGNVVNVDPNLEYEASWYIRSSAGSPRYAYITFESPETGQHCVEKAKDGAASANTWGTPVRPLITAVTTTWTKQTSRFTFKPGTRSVRISNLEFNNATNGSNAYIYIADLQISPKVPNQLDVDSAQNDAISANTEALKALGKKVLGASLVPYKTPSTQEVKDYAAGKLNYDPWADPEYLNAGYFIVTPMRGRVTCANPDQGTKNFRGSYVTVDSSIEYKVKFTTYASTSGSMLTIHMYDQNGNLAVNSTPFADSGKVSGGLIHRLTLPSGIKNWSGVIKFKPGTTQVQLGTFFWNDPSGSITTSQEFGGLEIVPNIPDANVVNELQDNAIRKNTAVGSENKQAIEALRDGLNAAVELGEVNGLLEGLRGEIEAEAKKREALQEKIDALQTEMIPRTIVKDDRVTYDDYVEISRNKVTAKGSWAGQLAITYISLSSYGVSKVSSTLVTRKNVPDGMTRSWETGDSIERVDYWVYRGRQRTIRLMNAGPYISGSSFSNGTWGVLATHKVGKTHGTGKIEWRADLLNADRGVTYRFAIKVNGAWVKNVSWTNQGPLTPLGDGKRTLKFEHEIYLPDNATVEVLGYADGDGGSHQAKVSLLQGKLFYVEDESR